ncbi:selenide, water dikinase [Flexistipes sinusarabici DSM 4947]|uniref:Selenide, water dikinase n=1 Tax=Flexistipes sinusarabici (strain ATCC 49648 / DSM 4947 / MAS 10) TaxID=717231 RepID=F8E532_FLESM|nr:selenide, water dikinase [Flexistipes sinusarabici DSM 4947]
MKIYKDDNLLVGFETSDDAGVYKIAENKYLVQSIDVITPVVDEPYNFGRIAAVNSLSDLYAMGGRPLTAMTLLMYNCDIAGSIMHEIMQGACDELGRTGCVLVGGHTLEDNEVKFGLSVTGMIDDGKIMKNNTLKPGDALVYTKPLGIGIITTAIKGEMAEEDEISDVTELMLLSNQKASEIIKNYPVSACTDITGYGLAGHALEMSKFSGCSINFFTEKIPVIEGALNYAEMGIIPAGAYHNRQFLGHHYSFSENHRNKEMLMFDPQTSGGLLIGVNRKYADELVNELKRSGYKDSCIIGEAVELADHYIVFE